MTAETDYLTGYGTPPDLRVKGRGPKLNGETPDLLVDLAGILPTLEGEPIDRAVDLMNQLAEYGWNIERMSRP